MLQYTSWQNKLDALQNKIDKNTEMVPNGIFMLGLWYVSWTSLATARVLYLVIHKKIMNLSLLSYKAAYWLTWDKC